MLKRLFSHKLLLILVLAAFLRLFLLNRVPPSLNWDEISMGYTAYSVSQTGMDEWGSRLPLFFRSYGEWKSAVYVYLLVPFIKIFGLNAWGVRLPSALAGILAVYLTFLIGKKLYSEKVGLWSAFFLAVSPWHLILSRPAFEANVSLTLILAGLYFFLRSLSLNHQSLFIMLSAVAFGLAPHTYNSAKVVVPLLVLYLLWTTKTFKNIKKLVIFLGILIVFSIPILVNLFSGRAQYRYSQVGVTTDIKGLSEFIDTRRSFPLPPIANKLLFNRGTYFLYKTTDNYLSYFDPSFLILEAGDHNQHHLKYFGVLYKTELILVVIGLYLLFTKKKKYLFLPLIMILLGIIPAAMTRDTHHVLRSLLTLPGWQLLAALGIVHLQTTKSKLLPIIHWSLVIEIISFMLIYFNWYPKAFARDWQDGYQEVATYLQIHENEYDQIVMTKWFGEPQLFLAFYNRWDPTWYQQENLFNLRYEAEGKIWLDQLPEYSIGKYSFKYLNWQEEDKSPRTLYIGKWDDFYSDSKVVNQINFPDGTPAFLLVEP